MFTMSGPVGCVSGSRVSCRLQVRVRLVETSGLTKLLEELKATVEPEEQTKQSVRKLVLKTG